MKFKYIIGAIALCFGSLSAYFIINLESPEKNAKASLSYTVVGDKQKIRKKPIVVKQEIKKINNEKTNKEKLRISKKMWNISKVLHEKRARGKSFDITDEELFEIMAVEEKSSFINANMIVLERELYEKAFEFGKGLETKLIKEFLYTYSYPKVLQEPKNRELRQDLLKSYLSSEKRMQLVYAVDSLSHLDFNSNEVEDLKIAFCGQKIPKKNEAQIALHYKFENFLRKYHIKDC